MSPLAPEQTRVALEAEDAFAEDLKEGFVRGKADVEGALDLVRT